MGKVSHETKVSTVAQAIKVAIGVVVLVGIFIYLDAQFAISKTFDLTSDDLKLIGISGLSFCLLWVVLDKFLFSPYFQLFEAREKVTVGAEAELKLINEETEDLKFKYESRLLEVRTLALKDKQAVLADAKLKAQTVIDAAQKEAQTMIEQARAQLTSEKQNLNVKAKEEAEALAADLVNKALM